MQAFAQALEAAQKAGAQYKPKTFDDFDALSDMIDEEYIEELERRQEERERRRQGGRAAEAGSDDGAMSSASN